MVHPRPLPLVLLALLLVALSSAQETRPRSPFEPAAWGVVYDIPATAQVVKENLPYHEVGGRVLTLDLYRLPEKKGTALPGIVFLNAIGDRLSDRVKDWGIYSSWPRLVAAHGMAGISMECDGERIGECLSALFAFLEREGAKHGVDAANLGTYAASANTTEAARFLMSAAAPKGVRAAVFYYGWPEAETLRRDLPVLLVTPERDLPDAREFLTRVFPKVLASGAPWTLEFASDLPHAFDAFSDNDASRRTIQRTLAFWKSHLEPVPQPTWKPAKERAVLEAMFGHDQPRILALLGEWIAENPERPEGYAARGTTLARMHRGVQAKPDLEKALALGSQDPGVHGCLGSVLAYEKEYDAAVEHMERAVAQGYYGPELLGTLGMAQLMVGKNEDAVASYERAIALGIPPGKNTLGVASYNLACGYARVGRTGDALGALERAVAEGFGTAKGLESDEDLAKLRGEERFLALVDRLSGD